ncbi:MAG TPA: glycosyltransferase family 87 protein [Methylomirabilota bacterium]|nr:glycosyltransferase family 87 protein [Methylomirabilota bacterium]
MDRDALARLARTALPIVALLSFAGGTALTLAVAGNTLGYDFLAYHQAIERVTGGGPLYDMSFTESGGFGLFYYPPTFAPLLLPFALLSAQSATWAWIGLSLVAFLAGVAILPVSRSVRWWILLLAGLSFPFVYAVKLGQVGPILFFAFAVGWRGLDDPIRLGASAAAGAAIKLQPGLVFIWALFTGRLRAVAVGAIVLLALALLATFLAGPGAWSDFLVLIRTVTNPITTDRNLTPGAIAYQFGASAEIAGVVQLVNTIAVVAAVVAAIRWTGDEASYLVAVVASQLVSPILWDHYAMLLLLPIAYLLSAGRWWALVIPLVTAWPLLGITPPVTYPVVFWITIVATLAVGRAARRSSKRWADSAPAIRDIPTGL